MNWVYWAGYTTFKAASRAFFQYRVIGREKLVEDRGVLVASNHESYVDPPLVGIAFDKATYYLARKTLFKGIFKWIYRKWQAIPVDQEKPDMTSLKRIIKLLRGGERVIIFPEGARTEGGNLQKAQAGTGLIVAKSKVMVQPVRIFGAREALPRGSGKMRFAPITIVVGDAIEFTPEELAGRGRDAYQAIADRIMDEIGKIKMP